jgi:hypothetical protein
MTRPGIIKEFHPPRGDQRGHLIDATISVGDEVVPL